MRYNIGIAFVLLALTSGAAQAQEQTLQRRSEQIKAAMELRDMPKAETLLREASAADPAAFRANNYDYLLARLLERRGAAAEATALYLEVLARNSVLAQYALWHLAGLQRAARDFQGERQYLARLIASFPASMLVTSAHNRMIDSLIDSADYRAAAALLKPMALARGASRQSIARLADLYLKSGDLSSARQLYLQLSSGSRDDSALAAAIGLDAIDESSKTPVDEFETLRRARVYLENRHWSEARKHLARLVERFPESVNRPEALYQIGFTYYREDQQDQAVTWFERAHSEFPERHEGEQGYYWVASALQKNRKYEEAAARYADFIKQYPSSDLIQKAYMNAVDSYRYAGKDDIALQWCDQIDQRFGSQPLTVIALFDRAKIELSNNRFGVALNLLTRLQAHPVNLKQLGAPGRGEVGFLRAVCLEGMGRLSEAASLYVATPDERDSYFGHRATSRLRAMARTDAGRRVIEPMEHGLRDQARSALKAGQYSQAKDAAARVWRLAADDAERRESLEILRASYSHLPAYSGAFDHRLIPIGRPPVDPADQPLTAATHQSLATELTFLGLYDEGAPELRLAGFSTSDGDTAYSMAVYSSRGDQANYAVNYAESTLRSLPLDYNLNLLPRDVAELLYPAPYQDMLARYSDKAGVDPRIVLSLARQESRFNPSVKSNASARGLLQFIPETAVKLAAEEGLKNFRLDDVYEPRIALRLAVRYMADLNRLFPDNRYAVAASYDTGEQNVERWIFRSRSSDVDRFVAEISIPETKDYVAKVIDNYWAYEQLYTPALVRRNVQNGER